MKKIFIYTGKGAYQARDVENFFAAFDFDFERLCQHELHLLDANSIFIVPGGRISDYLPSWDKSGIKNIRSFVKRGGIYIGICAGSYVAGKKYDGASGLNFVRRSLTYKKSLGLITVSVNDGKIQLLGENGPGLLETDGKVLLLDEKNLPQLVDISYGKGKVYLFASHPEGSLYYNMPPKTFSGSKYFNRFLRQLRTGSHSGD